MRLIDADKLLQFIHDSRCADCEEVKADRSGTSCAACQWDDIIMTIETAPTVGGWVSVKDRLPEYVGWYLVSLVNNRNGHRWKTPVVCEYSLDVWHEKDMFSNDVDATVTHWMPLPTPPEVNTMNEWISVNDSLPKNRDYMIVAIADEAGDGVFRYTDRGWYLKEADCWIVDDESRTDVYAWMSFPKPPEEVSGDD